MTLIFKRKTHWHSLHGRTHSMINFLSVVVSVMYCMTLNQNTQSKRCPRCDTVRTLSEFSKCSARKDGLQIWCKKCYSRRDGKVNSRKKQCGTPKGPKPLPKILECAICGIEIELKIKLGVDPQGMGRTFCSSCQKVCSPGSTRW